VVLKVLISPTKIQGKISPSRIPVSKTMAASLTMKDKECGITPEMDELLYKKIIECPTFDSNGIVNGIVGGVHIYHDAKLFAEMIQYQGFNPTEIRQKILQRIGTDEARKRDVHTLIKIGLERGNNIEKILKTSTPAFGQTLKGLRKFYRLMSKAGNNRNAITLSRVCMAFPKESCSYMEFCRNPIVSKETMTSICSKYPTQMMTRAFASLIPYGYAVTQTLKNAYMVHQFVFNSIINRTKYNEASKKQFIDDLIRFMEADVNRQFIPTEERLDTLIAWKMIKAVPADNPVNAYQVTKEIKEASDIWIVKYLGKTLVEDDNDFDEGDEKDEKKDDKVEFQMKMK